jgi:hypothetical protein
VKFLLFQELGKVNEAFENDSEQRDTDNSSLCNEVPTTTSTDETRNLVFIVLFINPLNTELNPICHLLTLAGAHHFVDVIRRKVNSEVILNH